MNSDAEEGYYNVYTKQLRRGGLELAGAQWEAAARALMFSCNIIELAALLFQTHNQWQDITTRNPICCDGNA